MELVDQRFLHVYLPHGKPLVIYYKPDHVPSEYTVLNFQIKNIKRAVQELTAKGVSFLQYKASIETDHQGISWDSKDSHLAWFKDLGGNILALIEN